MQRRAMLVGVLCALLLALPVATQEEDGNIAMVIFFKAKPGMGKQMEEGTKRHLDWHRQQNDPWTWQVFQVVSGDDTGMYVGVTFGHRWQDFDTAPVPREADEADAEINIEPYVGWSVVRYYAALPNVSLPPQAEGPLPLSTVVIFRVRPGKDAKFNYLIGKFHKAIEKTNWPVHYIWYALVNGGEGGTYAVVLPSENWAGFAPQEKSFVQMLEEAYGRQEAESLLHSWGKILKGSASHINRYRADLSYVPTSP